MSRGIRVLAVAGSSGGHIYPAAGFLSRLRAEDSAIETLLVLPRRCAGSPLLPAGCGLKYISTVPLKLSLSLGGIIALFRFLKGAIESLGLLLEFKPDVVVGFGSLDSLPVLLSAWLLREKTIIHEQNVIPGRANRLFARFADRVAVSFEVAKKYFKVSPKKIIFTGNPLRPELKKIGRLQALSFFGFSGGRFTVLVMGGSLGSRRINACFLEAAPALAAEGLQVIHICGAQDFAFVNESYKKMNLPVKLFAFLQEMQYAYSAADLVISRSGAGTIAELIYFGIPALLIPYPYDYQHQLRNAEVLAEKNAALIFKDEELKAADLKETLEGLMREPGKLKGMLSGYCGLSAPDAARLLVNAVLSLNYAH